MLLLLVTRFHLLYSIVVTIFQWSFVTNFDVILFHILSDVFIVEYTRKFLKNVTLKKGNRDPEKSN